MGLEQRLREQQEKADELKMEQELQEKEERLMQEEEERLKEEEKRLRREENERLQRINQQAISREQRRAERQKERQKEDRIMILQSQVNELELRAVRAEEKSKNFAVAIIDVIPVIGSITSMRKLIASSWFEPDSGKRKKRSLKIF